LQWTTLTDLRSKLMARWDAGDLLAEALVPRNRFPLRLTIKSPSSNELGTHFSAAQDWVQSLVKAVKQTALTLEWHEVNHRQLGRNKLPKALLLPSLLVTVQWLGKSKELQLFLQQADTLLSTFPHLQPWVLKNSHSLLNEKDNLPRLMAILAWIKANPMPGIYLRQLSLPGIDTKFIEQHKKLLANWLDLELAPEFILSEHRGTNQFETRYGFKEKPAQIRFRILDKEFYLYGLSDLTLTAEAFCCLNLAINTVFITENDINGLVFPDVHAAIVLFGRGYGFDFLKHAHWLKNKQVIYWGDIDTHGFAILNQCRHYLPQAKSLLMDKETLLNHRSHWTQEPKPTHAELKHLTDEESELYIALKNNQYGDHVRLEQEFVSYAALCAVITPNYPA
jgi:hypothetical protein